MVDEPRNFVHPARSRLVFRAAIVLLIAMVVAMPASASGRETRTHIVAPGQLLGTIARKYGISVQALCGANGLNENDIIRPGQRLVIPPPRSANKPGTHIVAPGQTFVSIAKAYGVTVKDLLAANRMRETDVIRPGQRLVIPPRKASTSSGGNASRGGSSGSGVSDNGYRTHRVEEGHRLSLIARRYGVSTAALAAANGIKPDSVLRVGQILKIPEPGVGVTPTGKRSYVRLIGYRQRYEGPVFDRNGRLLPAARAGFARVLGTGGKRPPLDERLIRLLVQTSDHFGGRPLRIVSGYRLKSYYQDSRHRMSRAVDFSIPGVPNEVLRDYLRRFRNVGVGYYPNSSFVHLDVRSSSAYWVDYARPGEPPRKTPYRIAATPRKDATAPSAAAEPLRPIDAPSPGARKFGTSRVGLGAAGVALGAEGL